MYDKLYDTAIAGGGLAGLSAAILLADQGFSVILLEKEKYPFHKVCGEYISMESWDFMQRLGLPLDKMNLPLIKKLVVTAPDGTMLQAELTLGGFGISRYKLDELLKNIAVNKGVLILEQTKVTDINFAEDRFSIKTSAGTFNARTCCGSYGKRSNLDIKWKRPFTKTANDKLSNYVGVKYHIRTNFPVDTIALHNFSNGYCGISKIEDDKYCLCYLTTAHNLKLSNNSLEQMEKHILSQNPHLKKLLQESERVYESPVTISRISFNKKTQVENNIFMLGDAAGMITPLCGNGMSMAMHSAKLAAANISAFLHNKISRKKSAFYYEQEWKREFSARLKTGRMIQRFFGKKTTTNLFVKMMKTNQWLTKKIISLTHGESF